MIGKFKSHDFFLSEDKSPLPRDDFLLPLFSLSDTGDANDACKQVKTYITQ